MRFANRSDLPNIPYSQVTIDFSNGGRMNNLPDELMAESYRQRVLDQVEQIRLERLALKARSYRPGIFGRTMFSFGNWLISTGKQLRRRYEVYDVKRSKQIGETWL